MSKEDAWPSCWHPAPTGATEPRGRTGVFTKIQDFGEVERGGMGTEFKGHYQGEKHKIEFFSKNKNSSLFKLIAFKSTTGNPELHL